MVTGARTPRVTAVLRSEERVKPLELFFDLVFVLALTQCTALMAAVPTWEGVAQGLLILGVLWWAWVGYAAMLGGTGVYLLAHVAFRWRNVHRFSIQRVVAAVVLAAFLPVALEAPALATLAFVAVALSVLIAYETVHFADLRDRMRHQLAGEAAAG
jgi:low temperature requirement protein LtrA